MKSFVNLQLLDIDDEPLFLKHVVFDTPEEAEDFKKNDGSKKRFREMIYETQGGKTIGKLPITVTSILENLINKYVRVELPSDTMLCSDVLRKFHNVPVGAKVDISDDQFDWLEENLKKEVEVWKDDNRTLRENRVVALFLGTDLPFICETIGIKLSSLDKKK